MAPAQAHGAPGAEAERRWVHPQANRELLLNGQPVAYWLKRSDRRTIGLTIDAAGLRVSVPRTASLAAADAVVQGKADWVLRKLAQVAERQHARHSERQAWADGASLAWLGGSLHLRLGTPPWDVRVTQGAPSAVFAPPSAPTPRARRGQPLVQRVGDELWVGLAPDATEAIWRRAVGAWAAQAAVAHFTQRLARFAPLLNVRWTRLMLTNAATRWGSAKSDGTIRLHWRLMQFSPEVVDYVVAHELSHLCHMDHSPRFWATVAAVVPDMLKLRAELRGSRLPVW